MRWSGWVESEPAAQVCQEDYCGCRADIFLTLPHAHHVTLRDKS